MMALDARAARYVWTGFIVLLGIWLLYLIRATLFIFVLALLFAYLLTPLVNLLDRFLPTRTRTPALALAYVIFVGAVGLGAFYVGSQAVEEANHLATDMPAQFERWKDRNIALAQAANASAFTTFKARAIERAQQEFSARSSDLLGYVFHAGVKFATVAGSVLHIVIIPILGFFFLKDGRAIRRYVVAAVDDGPRRTLLDGVLNDMDLLLAQYMRALVVLAFATACIYGAFFGLIGMPYAVLLAAVAGVLEFIPMVGPLSAGTVIVLVALVSGSHPLAVLAFLLLFRLFQDYVLQPHLMSRGVALHPVLVLFGVFAGAEIAGIPGTFLSVPALALARVFYLRLGGARLKPPVEAAP